MVKVEDGWLRAEEDMARGLYVWTPDEETRVSCRAIVLMMDKTGASLGDYGETVVAPAGEVCYIVLTSGIGEGESLGAVWVSGGVEDADD